MDKLPHQVLFLVLRYLDPTDLPNLYSVNKHFSEYNKNKRMWERLYEHFFGGKKNKTHKLKRLYHVFKGPREENRDFREAFIFTFFLYKKLVRICFL